MPVFERATRHDRAAGGHIAHNAEVITSADGFDLTLFSQGDPTKPTVVLVHGFPDDYLSFWAPGSLDTIKQAMFDHVVAALTDNGNG